MNLITIHLFPHELEEYKRIVDNLNVSMFNIQKNQVKLYVCLNMNPEIINCTGETRRQIVEAFYNTNKKLVIQHEENVNTDTNFYGVNEQRRYTINQSSDDDLIINLDCDIYFHPNLLRTMIKFSDELLIKNKMYIITPECVRLWDSTWDCLVNAQFKNNLLGFYKKANPSEITKKIYGDISLNKINQFKWGGGWFTGISARLAKLIGIPKSFKGYGPDDTFMMKCCEILRNKKYKLDQYVISGMVICENQKYTNNRDMFKENIPKFRNECNKNFSNEIDIFSKKL